MAGNILFDAAKKNKKLTPEQKRKARKTKIKGAIGDAVKASDDPMAKSIQAGMAVRSAYDKRKKKKKV